jgi:hypothetical protein
MNILFLIIIVLLGFSTQIGNSKINIYAHLGGFLTGILLLPVIQKPVNENDGAFCLYKYWFFISLVLLLIFFVSGIVDIYLI